MEDGLVGHGEVEGLSLELRAVGELNHSLGAFVSCSLLYLGRPRESNRCGSVCAGSQCNRCAFSQNGLTADVLHGVGVGSFCSQRDDAHAGLGQCGAALNGSIGPGDLLDVKVVSHVNLLQANEVVDTRI